MPIHILLLLAIYADGHKQLEFVHDRQTKKPFPLALGFALAVHDEALALESGGVMIYPGTGSADGEQGDHVILAPAFNVDKEEIDMIVWAVGDAVDSALGKLVMAGKIVK